MLRNLLFLGLVAAATCLLPARPATAGPISLQNPYRSFNITGVNYGSVRWEQTHGNRSTASRQAWTPRRSGHFFRRR